VTSRLSSRASDTLTTSELDAAYFRLGGEATAKLHASPFA
jgi:hypothetical protein